MIRSVRKLMLTSAIRLFSPVKTISISLCVRCLEKVSRPLVLVETVNASDQFQIEKIK